MMTNMRCARCRAIFEAGKVYGRYCQYGADCGPIELVGPKLRGNLAYDPMPRVDLKLPPPVGFVTQAEHNLLVAALADMTRQRDEARAEGVANGLEAAARKLENFRAHLNFNAMLYLLREEPLPEPIVVAVSKLLNGIAADFRALAEGAKP